ncbi:MAG: dihydrolipoyl dehydrogenase [Candidatus Neomarinimicrobiota bacterium]
MAYFDIAVLGGGPGGYVAAIRGAQLGQKVCIIDKDKLGGVCLNWGCIPTKALIKNAEVYNLIKNADKYGIKVQKLKVDFKRNVKRSRDVSSRLSKGIEFLMKKNKIKHFKGIGSLMTNNSIEVKTGNAVHIVDADKIIIATGARPRTFPGMNFDGIRVISSKEAMMLETPPRDLTIIGSGAIGVEFAYYFNEFGTKVHIIEMMDKILPNEDNEVSKEIEKSFQKSGIKISKGMKVLKIKGMKTKAKVHVENQGSEEIFESDKVLLAVGVVGNIENLGLEDLGIETYAGSIKTDQFSKTNIDNIYAIGDVCGPPWLAHVASAQGHVAVNHAVGLDVIPIDYSNIPGCTYCQPQVGSLGMTEEEAIKSGHKIQIGKFIFQASGKAMAVGNTTGFVKLIFDKKYGELLGAHIVGSEATEMISELGIAKALETTWDDIAMTVHAHPTLSEAIMEAAMDAYGHSIHQ